MNGECQKLVKKLNLDNQIKFLGFRKDIPALIKISNDNEPIETANKSTAHLYIVNPFKEKRSKTKDNLMSAMKDNRRSEANFIKTDCIYLSFFWSAS